MPFLAQQLPKAQLLASVFPSCFLNHLSRSSLPLIN
uniref:Uncharacterized protein n=1 Tax=Arundo donax TaxID=35708 RepID=A0A0A9AZU3_ARUDO